MARSDLLISLVKAASSDDKPGTRTAAEAIIAEERAKQHHVLADRLTEAMRGNGYQPTAAAFVSQNGHRHREFLLEAVPRRRIEDLFLSDITRRACEELIEEQHRAGVGETASRLKSVFDYARTTPCVLFFDEFDAVGKERGDTHETGEIKRVVTSLLMQLDDTAISLSKRL